MFKQCMVKKLALVSLATLIVAIIISNAVVAQSDDVQKVPLASVSVIIEQVSNVNTTNDGCGSAPDFYARIAIDGQQHVTKAIRDRHVIFPTDWSYQRSVRQNVDIPIVVQLWEDDWGGCGGKDDHLDIVHGGSDDARLWVRLSGNSCQIYLDWTMLQKWETCDQTIVTSGTTVPGGSARIYFRVQPFSVKSRFGAIAYSARNEKWGWSWNYKNRQSAENRAINECKFSDCRSVLWFRDSYGALSQADDGVWKTDWGNTRAEAERKTLQTCRQVAAQPATCRIKLVVDAKTGEILNTLTP